MTKTFNRSGMKSIVIFFAAVSFVVIVLLVSCKKEPCEDCLESNKPPAAKAGIDQFLTLPIDSVVLDGSSSSDQDGKITEWHWKKVSGPDSIHIGNARRSRTPVKNFVGGT